MRKWVYTNGRLTRIERHYGGVERVAERTEVTYDAYGRMRTVTYGGQYTPGVTETYDYFPSGQLQAKTMAVFGGQLKAEFGYDAEGRLVTTKYPKGETVYLKYNAADRPNELWKTMAAPDPDQLQASVTYDWRGLLATMTKPDGWQQTWGYNEGGLLTSHGVGLPWTGYVNAAYAYEAAAPVTGKLQTMTQNGNTVSYGYDTLGRLATASSAAWNQSYTYDGFGNLYRKTGSTGTVDWAWMLNSEKNQTGSFDAAGNAAGYTWDADNRLLHDPGYQKHYLYDLSSQRVAESSFGSGTTVITFRAGGMMLGRYTYNGGTPAAGRNSSIWAGGGRMRVRTVWGRTCRATGCCCRTGRS
jgi:YD repeat-containing protein